MNKLRLLGVVCAYILLHFSVAQASLIGDTVLVENSNSPVAGSGLPSSLVLVEEGWGDFVNIAGVYLVNVEADAIIVDFMMNDTFGSTDFTGLIVSDLDWVGSLNAIVTGVTIDTNLAGWNDSRVSYTDDSVLINYESQLFKENDYLYAAIATSASVVPLPAAAWLLGSGLLGLVGMARRKKAA